MRVGDLSAIPEVLKYYEPSGIKPSPTSFQLQRLTAPPPALIIATHVLGALSVAELKHQAKQNSQLHLPKDTNTRGSGLGPLLLWQRLPLQPA